MRFQSEEADATAELSLSHRKHGSSDKESRGSPQGKIAKVFLPLTRTAFDTDRTAYKLLSHLLLRLLYARQSTPAGAHLDRLSSWSADNP